MRALKLPAVISAGLLVLVAVMPFHAFLSVWLGHLLGHQTAFQSWKEVLLSLLVGLTIVMIIQEPSRLARWGQPWVIGAIVFMLWGILITVIQRPNSIITVYGIKTDFEFLIAGMIAVLVASPSFIRRALIILLIGTAVVAGFDLLQIFLLPPDFLTHFGYGLGTIAPYQHIAQGSSALRFPSTLGGPNQLGTFLILPICLCLYYLGTRGRKWYIALLLACIISLIWTFSRSAWVGAGMAGILTLILSLPLRYRRTAAVVAGLALVAGVLILPLITNRGGQFQYLVLHSSVANHNQANLSDAEHAASLTDGAAAVKNNPFGHGLGTAGPATFRAGKINIIEDYYLQIGYEVGIAGMVLFGFIVASLIYALFQRARNFPLALPLAATIIGISIVALVLPAWVDSSTALIAWIICGASSGLPVKAAHV